MLQHSQSTPLKGVKFTFDTSSHHLGTVRRELERLGAEHTYVLTADCTVLVDTCKDTSKNAEDTLEFKKYVSGAVKAKHKKATALGVPIVPLSVFKQQALTQFQCTLDSTSDECSKGGATEREYPRIEDTEEDKELKAGEGEEQNRKTQREKAEEDKEADMLSPWTIAASVREPARIPGEPCADEMLIETVKCCVSPDRRYLPKERPPSHLEEWQEVKVFISSTFKDMHGERDQLTRFVFPALQRRCAEIHVHVTPVDLRWGVTATGDDEATLGVCLRLIEECSPFFIGLLGDRYGYVSQTGHAGLLMKEEYSCLAGLPDGLSTTHLEMLYALSKDRKEGEDYKHRSQLVYIRDEEFLSTVPTGMEEFFIAESRSAKEHMEELKNMLREQHLVTKDGYKASFGGVVDSQPRAGGLEAFADDVLENLWLAIAERFGHSKLDGSLGKDVVASTAEAVAARRRLHELVVENQSRMFIGREKTMEELLAYASFATSDESDAGDHRTRPLMVTGEPGSGKSSLMAAFSKTLMKRKDLKDLPGAPDAVIVHFVGCGAQGSTSMHETLFRLCLELCPFCKPSISTETLGQYSYRQLEQLFMRICSPSKANRVVSRVVLIIDALNQLQHANNPQLLNWLPETLSHKVRLIVSSLAGPFVTNFKEKIVTQSSCNLLSVELLSHSERRAIVEKRLGARGKELSDTQLALLVNKTEAVKPLYLTIACEELCIYGNYDMLTETIQYLPPNVPDLLQQVLKRLEVDVGREIVTRAFAALASVEDGLLPRELRILLAEFDPEENDPGQVAILRAGKFTHMMVAMQAYVRSSSDSMEACDDSADALPLSFFHEQLLLQVTKRYLDEPRKTTGTAHEKPFGELRSMEEAAHHFSWSIVDGRDREKNVTRRKIIHRALAALFHREADPFVNGSWKGSDRGIRQVVGHYLAGGEYKAAIDILTDLSFVEVVARRGLIFYVISLYLSLLEGGDIPFQCKVLTVSHDERIVELYRKRVFDYFHMIRGKSYVLHGRPQLTFSLATCQEATSAAYGDATGRWNSGIAKQAHLRWRNKPLAMDRCMMTLTQHSHIVTSCAVSPVCSAEAFLVSGSNDCTVKLWSQSTGEELASFEGAVGHKKTVSSVAICPAGKLVASTSWDCSTKVWDVKSRTLLRTLKQRTAVLSCAFSSTGEYLLTSGEDKYVRLWCLSAGKVLDQKKAHKSSIPSLCRCSGSADVFATASGDRTVKLWRVRVPPKSLRGKESASIEAVDSMSLALPKTAHGLAINGDHTMLACASEDNTVTVWSLPVLAPGLFPHNDTVSQVHEAKRVSAAEGEVPGLVHRLVGHRDSAVTCSFSPDGKMLYSGSKDNLVMAWNLSTGFCEAWLQGHTGTVYEARVSGCGSYLVTASYDRSVKLWKAVKPTGDSSQSHLRGHSGRVLHCAFSPDGKSLATASRDRSLKTWDTTTGDLQATFLGARSNLLCCQYSPDGKVVMTSSRDGYVRLYDAQSSAKRAVFCHSKGEVSACAYSPDGRTLVTCGDDKCTRLWDSTTLEPKGVLFGHRDGVTCVSFSPDGLKLLTGSKDGTLKLWSTKTRRKLATYARHVGEVSCCSFSTDGETLVSGGADGNVFLWSAVNGKLLHTFGSSDAPAHDFTVTGCGHTADGKYVVTGSTDSLVILWHATTLQEVCSFTCNSRITCVATSPVDSEIAVCDGSGATYLLLPVISTRSDET